MSGIADAASAPKTKASRIKVSGIEIASAIFRSSEIFFVIACPTTATPPAYSRSPSNSPSYFSWKSFPRSSLSAEKASPLPKTKT